MSRTEEPLEPASPNAELDLVREALSGNRGAFDRLFDRHFPRVISLAQRRLGGAVAAEAATRAVFETLITLLPAFRGERPLATWISTLAWHEIESRRIPRRVARPADRRQTPALLP